ncbi:flagellar hook-basal body protein [Lentibacter algarum]|jgi:flagellar hook protein FlgE|uniref:Flagellar hook protein FlgE n=1 Tax=Lentibacter algarum TaxID=576131 RepID=A0A1H3IU88_9RHOB|nr:flagellar hook-basal body complex protein [Lentibacter algarum]SDY31262.1 flagellar hook-basal body protein [Lentibacter algarum]
MSFYTALTGLNGAQADISATSNNIANVGTTGFKRSRAEFGDIFATSPLQNASSSIGSGTILKGIKQQFTQGNIASSLNALDLAISGQGFFALKPSLTSTQTVYTRNGSFNVDNDRYVVDSAGQYLMTYPVNLDGSVTAKDLDSAVPLQLPVTSGEPKATGKIDLGVNVPADAPVVTELEQFADGYQFDPSDANSYTNSTSITIFDDLGNPTIATIYFIKTQNASAEDPTNKYDTRLVINDTIIDPDLVSAVDDTGKQLYIDRFGAQTTVVPDDNYFLEGKGAPLYKMDDLNQQVKSQPATLQGEQSSFDFGEEGDKLVEIVTDPLLFKATREAGNADSDIYWGKDFLTVNVDDGDAPVSINLRPGKYNAEQLASEVERAINEAYGDDKKIQIFQNVDDKLTIDLFKLSADGTLQGLGDSKIEIDLLQDSSVSTLMGMDVEGASPDFTREEFLAHTQTRLIDELNEYIYDADGSLGAGAATLGVEERLFVRSIGAAMDGPYDQPEVVTITHTQDTDAGDTVSQDRYLAHSYYGKRPSLSVYDQKAELLEVDANGDVGADGNAVVYDNTQNTLTVYVPNDFGTPTSSSIRLVGASINDDFQSHLNGRELRIFENVATDDYRMLRIDTSGLNLPEAGFNLDSDNISILYEPSQDLEAFFEGATSTIEGGFETFNSKRIVVRETGEAAKRSSDEKSLNEAIVFGSTLIDTTGKSLAKLGLPALGTPVVATETVASDAAAVVATETAAASSTTAEVHTLALGLTAFDKRLTTINIGSNSIKADLRSLDHADMNAVVTTLNALSATTAVDVTFSTTGSDLVVTANAVDTDLGEVSVATAEAHTLSLGLAAFNEKFTNISIGDKTIAADLRTLDHADMAAVVATLNDLPATQIAGVTFGTAGDNLIVTANALSVDLGDVSVAAVLNGASSKVAWVDENNPPIKIAYDETNQRLQFNVDRTVLGTGTGSNFNAFTIYGASDADSTNGLGIPAGGNAEQVLIRGGEILSTEPFIADGEEVQLNDKRYGVSVSYNGDTKSFTVASGTTGEEIDANGALGVSTDQKASNIQIGRRIISSSGDGSTDVSESINLDNRIIGAGENALFGFGASKQDFTFQEGRGLAAEPAIATGRAAQGDLTEVFRLTSNNGENRFNVSVNGIAGIIDIPPGNYVGTTLATALEERINQISDPVTGQTVGGVTVRYSTLDNGFVFQTGTTGDGSTIKVKGAARLGLDEVPLGVGSVPKIFNLVQATNADGIALYVDSEGNVVTTPPAEMVDGYFPLYIDEGELTFDKTGKLVSPKNNVRYEQQAEGFSISLDIDYSTSSQFAQPFSVLSVEQDGFTSGRLDGLEIDSSGTIRANYTNGQNNPLGKIVVANFNNQNGLKQIGNATYVETAVSGTPQVGEAGAEGFGNILSGSLERSNVDITEELVNLITAQRNYQASAKAIETTTSLTQTIINIRM